MKTAIVDEHYIDCMLHQLSLNFYQKRVVTKKLPPPAKQGCAANGLEWPLAVGGAPASPHRAI
eukprot:3913282-Amphidinium_carterae.1